MAGKIRLLLLPATLLFLAFGCRVNEKGFDGSTVYGDVSAEYATWEANDSIGVAGLYNGNNLFVATSQSSGAKSGTFKGNVSSEPVSAYFPFNPKASASAMESVQMTLSNEQKQSGTKPCLKYDVRVSGKPAGSTSEGFTFKFVHKLALLRFELIPDSEMENAVLYNIDLKAEGCILAGDCTLNLKNPEEDLSFTAGKDEVSTLFEESPQLKQGETIVCWMFINPDIEKDAPLVATIATDNCNLIAELTAAADYEAGKCYTVSLDIAALKAAGKCYEDKGEGTVFTEITKFGVYNLSRKIISGIVSYTECVDQYSYRSTSSYCYFSIVNVDKGYATEISFPKDNLTVGKNYSLKSTSVGIALTDGYYNADLVKKDGNTYWFKDNNNHLGFILSK